MNRYFYQIFGFHNLKKKSKKLQKDVTHITEVFSILLGQDNSWEVNDTGELDRTWVLAVEPFIEDSLGMLHFDDIYTVLR